jgi:phosphopantothenoylcysteine decarboxylase/phosphopantothenate--cysteine ligase
MTQNAAQFISALTLQAVSANPVRSELFDEAAEAGMGHIELARWADAIVVAPASAGFMARLAYGFADDLLSTLCLAADCPIAVAPAMNTVMWDSKATQKNIQELQSQGVSILGPGVGDQACGETGPGRMLLPEEIVDRLGNIFADGPLKGIKVMITTGSTWEAIDPVRGISNRSSGKMGFAVADAAVKAGAEVTLISGPTTSSNQVSVHQLLCVTSAQEMLDVVQENLSDHGIFISVAAVADYRPSKISTAKIKKRNTDALQMELVRNPDILAEVKKQHPNLFAVGFAAETENLISEGRRKLLSKGVDLIAANNVDGALGSDSNTIELIDRAGVTTLGPALKTEVAEQLIEQISVRFHAKGSLQNTR